jgi:hypothetical protein
MYVDDKTFESIYKDCKDYEFGKTLAKVISANHLMILKLHAMKHYQEHRFVKDYSDLQALIKRSNEKIDSEEFRQKCLKYSSTQVYERLLSDLKYNKN